MSSGELPASDDEAVVSWSRLMVVSLPGTCHTAICFFLEASLF